MSELWPPGRPEVLWFDPPTGTALVLARSDLHRVALFPGPCIVIETGSYSVACSRAGQGWGVQGLGGRVAAGELVGLPAVATAVLAAGSCD